MSRLAGPQAPLSPRRAFVREKPGHCPVFNRVDLAYKNWSLSPPRLPCHGAGRAGGESLLYRGGNCG